MKILSIKGRLTRDCEVKDNFVRFSVAVDGFENGQSKPEFVDVALFGKRGQTVASYLKKGQEVAVSGDFSTFTTEQGRTYLKIKTNDVSLCGSPKREDAEPRQAKQDRPVSMASAMEDDIPFSMEWR